MALLAIVAEDKHTPLCRYDDFVLGHGQDHAVYIARIKLWVFRRGKDDSVDYLEATVVSVVRDELNRTSGLSERHYIGLLIDCTQRYD